MSRAVDFFIVGEPKSGTTALAQFLGEHPRVGIATPKEPHFFATDLHAESDVFHGDRNHNFPIRTEAQYRACFTAVADKGVWGEGSTHYLCSFDAAANIAAHNPSAKIIAMFRNPADFLHSLHMQYVNNGSEDVTDFAQALALEDKRKAGRSLPKGVRTPSHIFYSERVRYAEQLQRFLDVFPREQVEIIIMEEFNRDNRSTYLRVLDFLGLEHPTVLPNFGVVHGSKAPRFKRLHRALNHPSVKYGVLRIVGANRYDAIKDKAANIMLKKQARQKLDPELRQRLMMQFEPEVRTLAKLVDRPDLLKLWGYESD